MSAYFTRLHEIPRRTVETRTDLGELCELSRASKIISVALDRCTDPPVMFQLMRAQEALKSAGELMQQNEGPTAA